nr:unnamed protein product [Digitaria exilis]
MNSSASTSTWPPSTDAASSLTGNGESVILSCLTCFGVRPKLAHSAGDGVAIIASGDACSAAASSSPAPERRCSFLLRISKTLAMSDASLAAVGAAVGVAAAAAVVAAAALAGGDEVEGRRVGRGVAAAELHLAAGARVVDGEGWVEGAARELLVRRRLGRGGLVVVVVVGAHEVAEGLAGDLAALEEEVEVHGELPLGHARLAEHEQNGAHHVPQAPRHHEEEEEGGGAGVFKGGNNGGGWLLKVASGG